LIYFIEVKVLNAGNRNRWPMIKKIELSGIAIDNYTVREAMLMVESYLDNVNMNTIEAISMEMLVRAREDETLKGCIEGLDLAIINEKEILYAAGVKSPQRMKETAERQFFKEFMKRIIRNNKTVYLFGATKERLEELEEFLLEDYDRLNIIGKFAMEDCIGDFDGVVNEINIASPDVIFSVLPTPEQEYFLVENKEKLSAGIWYGLGSNYAGKQGLGYVTGLVKRMIHKGMLKRMVSQYDKEK